MKYIKIKFTFGLDCEAYQMIDKNMCVIDYVDLEGNTLELPDVTESIVVDPEIKENLFQTLESSTLIELPTEIIESI